MSQHLKDLLARIEGAAGGSRDTDAELWWHLSGSRLIRPLDLRRAEKHGIIATLGGMFSLGWRNQGSDVPEYTTSVDDALSLVNNLLPKEWPFILNNARQELAERYAWHMAFARPGQLEALPLAIVGSLLKTLLASQPADQTRQGEKP